MRALPWYFGVIAVLASVLSALSEAEVISVLPGHWAPYIAVGSTIVAAVSRAIGGKDGDPHTPD